jgi:TonB-linked SusC/RagA family outer membrane protein
MRLSGRFVSMLASVAVASFAGVPAGAQTGSVTGTVLNASTGQPLDAVQVSLVAEGTEGAEGARLGSLSQATGRFFFGSVPVGRYILRAELLGFRSVAQVVDVPTGQAVVADLRLSPQAISLSEIVVTGVAGATQRTKLPFDVAQVRSADLPVPGMNATQSLQGKVAGATVVMGSGRPGSAPSILLRGVNSLNASGRDQEPLYIVDGVILGAGMVDLDALDIQSIEVVKGAAAASLYGSRAGAGVIQIRTRRGAGVADDQVRYTLRNEYGGSRLAHVPERLLAKKHRFQTSQGRFVDLDGSLCDWLECSQPMETGADPWHTYNDQEWPGRTFDQVSRFFTGARVLQSNVSAEGRVGRTNFLVSASHMDQEGILRFTPGFRRDNFRLNVDQALTDRLTVQTSTMYSSSSQGRPSETSGNTLFDLTRVPAGVDLLALDENGELRPLINPTDSESLNPLYTLKNTEEVERRRRFLGGVNLHYSPAGWLTIDADVSFDRLDTDWEVLLRDPQRCQGECPTGDEGTVHKLRSRNEAMSSGLTASTRWNLSPRIRNSSMIRYLYENEDYEASNTSGYDFAAARAPTFSSADPRHVSSGTYFQTVRAVGYFFITNFDLHDRYVVDALIRNDGSSLFGSDRRRQWYYRLGGAWRLGKEEFFDVPRVDELKLRYSLGTAGGRPSFPARYEIYSTAGGRISGVSLGNLDLKPEFATEQEVGFDLAVLNYRAILSLTYARSSTRDQILPVPQPSYTGFWIQWRNAGTIESKTWEATLGLRLLERPDLDWSVKALFDRTRSRISELRVPPFVYGVGGLNMENVFYARKGEKVGTLYGGIVARGCADLPAGVPCDGFQVNDDGLLVWTGGGGFSDPQWGTDGPVVGEYAVKWGTPFAGVCSDASTGEESWYCRVGNTMPDYNAGLSTTVTWKGLTAYVLLSRSAGFDVYNQPLQWGFLKRMTGYYDQDANAPEGEKKPLGYYDAWYSATGGLAPSNLFVEDGGFTKLREVSLGYRWSPPSIRGLPGLGRFSSVGLAVTGRNLFTWTSYRGYDPEVGKTGGDTGSSAIARVDGYTYPNFRTWTAAIEVIF